MPDEAPIYGLVCSGGGAHGAYQVGSLKYIHEHFCNGEASPFRVFSGTSAGSLNTSFFASRSFDAKTSRLHLEEMWLDFHVAAYHGNVVWNAIRAIAPWWKRRRYLRAWSLLDPTPLYEVVEKGFRTDDLARAIRERTTLGAAVSATELGASRLVWFIDGDHAVDWHTPGMTAIRTSLAPPHIQASCSVPIAFPPVRIADHYYIDGGVANKHPFTPALSMGATRLLCITTDRPLPTEMPKYPDGFQPRIGEVVRSLLEQLGHDYAYDQARTISLMNFFRTRDPSAAEASPVGPLVAGRKLRVGSFQPTEILLLSPSRRIRASELYGRETFEREFESRSTSLAFHRDFVRPLIELGYADAAARHDDLAAFFDAARPQAPLMPDELLGAQ